MRSSQSKTKILLVALSGNTLIALVLWTVMECGPFGHIWVTSQCIGLSICYLNILLDHLLEGGLWKFFNTAVSIVLGLGFGMWIAGRLGALPEDGLFSGSSWSLMRMFVVVGVATFAFILYFESRERIHKLSQARQEAELREVVGQKAALAAHLRLLQAQIEPHFLFNTLANLHSLIGRDDPAARALLEKLNDYLRASLAHSRAERTVLADECGLLECYLGIQAQRMSGRLTWEIDLPEELRRRPFPPMLLQPLVENAVRHGLESKVGAGHVRIAATETPAGLALTVSDNGTGLNGQTRSGGMGLANVRERLASLFGEAARLDLAENHPSGLTATLWIPRAAPAP